MSAVPEQSISQKSLPVLLRQFLQIILVLFQKPVLFRLKVPLLLISHCLPYKGQQSYNRQ